MPVLLCGRGRRATDADRCAVVAAERVRRFECHVVVVHGLELAIPQDGRGSSMTGIEILVGEQVS